MNNNYNNLQAQMNSIQIHEAGRSSESFSSQDSSKKQIKGTLKAKTSQVLMRIDAKDSLVSNANEYLLNLKIKQIVSL